MTITVEQLIAIPDLRTWIEAGAHGRDRAISWAHVCELPDPTEWLSAGELVLTTGLGIPPDPADQRAYMQRLADAGLSGVAIGEHMFAPPLSDEMLLAADERSLPLLITAYEVPFTAIVRAVAEANRSEEHARVLETLRLYEMARHAAIAASGTELLEELGRIVGCTLHVLDHERGVTLIAAASGAPADVAGTLAEASAARDDPMPAVLRLHSESGAFLAVTVPSSRPATMVALPNSGAQPDLTLLRHVAGVAAQEIERESAERERRRRLGAELLAGLIDGRLGDESAAQPLAERGLYSEPRVLAACLIGDNDAAHADIHLRLEDREVPHLLLRRAPLLFALLPGHADAVAAFRAEIGDGVPVGLSDPLGRTARAPDATREARWACDAARTAGTPIGRYGEDAPSPFLPRSLSEADRLVRHVLGPLIDYDATHDAELVRSLRVFLSHDRSWKKAAEELHIHKQTLVYRMRRVEELTGRKLGDTGNVAELWLALKADEL